MGIQKLIISYIASYIANLIDVNFNVMVLAINSNRVRMLVIVMRDHLETTISRQCIQYLTKSSVVGFILW